MKYRSNYRKRQALYCLPIIFLIVICGTASEKKSAMENLIPDNIKGWTVADTTETYDRQSIFDYINGAGEVYRLYDFKNVLVKKFAKPDNPIITVEIFDMGSSRDAYGIFSHSRESDDSFVGQGSEFRGSLLCFWRNRYYVCVSAEKRTDEAMEAVTEMALTIAGNIGQDGPTPDLIYNLPTANLRVGTLRYFHKHTSLNYHYYLASQNLLNLDEQTEAVMALYDPGPAHLMCARYDNALKAIEAYNGFIEGYIPKAKETGLEQIKENSWVKAIIYDKYVIIAFDAPSAEQAAELVEATRKNVER
ncbi:MAG: hypothetical protein GY839_06390 [candidate division Zixibacteria bacterium]|nr:hypothetical protein [candidate division Zixibacteria bacterium]